MRPANQRPRYKAGRKDIAHHSRIQIGGFNGPTRFDRFYPDIFALDDRNLRTPPGAAIPLRRLADLTMLPPVLPAAIFPLTMAARVRAQSRIRQPVGHRGPGGAHNAAGPSRAGPLDPTGLVPAILVASMSMAERLAIQTHLAGFVPYSGLSHPSTSALALMTPVAPPAPAWGCFFDRLPEFLGELGAHLYANDFF